MSYKMLISILFWLLFLIFPSSGVGAEEKTLDAVLELSLSELMRVKVKTPSNIPQSPEDAPGTTLVITKQQIEERGYANLLDLLQDMPGIDVQEKTTEEFFNLVVFRGNTGNNKFLIMRNGIRVSSPTGEHIPISNNFPLFHAERVEVVLGPVSAVYGADAFTGVVNIITENPNNTDEVAYSVVEGPDDYHNASLDIKQTLHPSVHLALGGHWHNSQNPDLAKTYTEEFKKVDVFDSDGNLFLAAGKREPFSAQTKSYSSYMDLNIKDKLFLGFTQSNFWHPTTIGTKREKAIFERDAAWGTQIYNIHGKLKSKFSDSLSGESLLSYSNYETLPGTKFTNTFASFNAFKYARGKEIKVDQQLDYQYNKDHKVTGGLTFEHFNSIPKSADLPNEYDLDKESGNQDLYYLGSDGTLPVQFFEQDYNNYGAFIQGLSKWNDWLSTTIGARADYDSRFYSTFNPRVGVTLKPADATVIKLLYAEAFLAPSPNLAFSHFGSFGSTFDANGNRNSSFFHIANPDLGPEKSRTAEINLTHFFDKNFTARASFYHTIVDDYIDIADGEANNTTFIPGGNLNSTAISKNIGTLRTFGGEISVDKQFFWDSKSLKAWINYSWVDGTLEEPLGVSAPAPYAAKNKVKAGVTFIYRKDYFITPRVIWVDQTPHIRTEHSDKVSQYALVNLHLGIKNIFENSKQWVKFSAYLTITNLIDEKYFNAGGGSNQFGSSPQDPRRFFVGIRQKF